jgi:hypothetical protein
MYAVDWRRRLRGFDVLLCVAAVRRHEALVYVLARASPCMALAAPRHMPVLHAAPQVADFIDRAVNIAKDCQAKTPAPGARCARVSWAALGAGSVP